MELDWSIKAETTKQKTLKVVATIPCLNTEDTITAVVIKARRYVDEVIVIDDGSKDKTAETARLAGATVISHGINKGYGEAIKSCIIAAQAENADILVTIDGDGQHDPAEIPGLLSDIMNKEADLVIGSRFLPTSLKRQTSYVMRNGIPRYRRFGIGVITFVWNFACRLKITDAQSGFRAYNRKLLNKLSFSEKGMSISIEIIEKARKDGLRIKETPISCSYENNNSHISIKSFKDGISMVFSVLKIRLKNNLSRSSVLSKP